jgi:hypothetical protein
MTKSERKRFTAWLRHAATGQKVDWVFKLLTATDFKTGFVLPDFRSKTGKQKTFHFKGGIK